MSLAARSADMEHFKSTIATAAIAAFGLLTAAHILHPGNFERTVYPSRPVAAVSSQAAAWVDPPASLPVAVPAQVAEQVADKAVQVPVAWTSTSAPPAETTAIPAPRRKVSAAHRHRTAQKQVRIRQAELARPVAAQPAAPAAPKAEAKRSDPIGDLIRGLGLGSDS